MVTLPLLCLTARSANYPPVKGIAFHLCSCSVPCPCMFSSGNDMAGCDIVAVYHFSSGGYVDSHLAGATMVVVSRPQSLIERDHAAKVPDPLMLAVYVPKDLAKKQQSDLDFILLEHQSRFAMRNLETRPVQINFKAVGSGYSVRIPGILTAATKPITGAEDEPMTVSGVTFQEGSEWTLGKTTVNKYTDPKDKDWHWDYSAKNGAWCKFEWHRINHP